MSYEMEGVRIVFIFYLFWGYNLLNISMCQHFYADDHLHKYHQSQYLWCEATSSY